jgi:hypothetical protein
VFLDSNGVEKRYDRASKQPDAALRFVGRWSERRSRDGRWSVIRAKGGDSGGTSGWQSVCVKRQVAVAAVAAAAATALADAERQRASKHARQWLKLVPNPNPAREGRRCVKEGCRARGWEASDWAGGMEKTVVVWYGPLARSRSVSHPAAAGLMLFKLQEGGGNLSVSWRGKGGEGMQRQLRTGDWMKFRETC